MTPGERFERIEKNLAAASDAIMATAQLALRNEEALKKMAAGWELVQNNMQSLIDAHQRTEESLQRYVDAHQRTEESLQHYIDASDARMKRIEENLDALIRAIIAEHSNGQGKLGE